MKRKVKATFNKPVVAYIPIDLPEDEFIKARMINQIQRSMVNELRKMLEKQIVELTVEDIKFELEEE